ncbi:MAG TPA: MFS transporter [Pyrinomonadaceae bacterium]|nr:MFS transporter [Pyrinomonadaceae bacterium]
MEPKSSRTLSVLLHIVFFVSGIATVLIGQVLPILATSFSLSDLEAGYFFPAQFSGSVAGTLMTSWFGRRNRFKQASMVGSVAMAAGIMAMNLPDYYGCLAGFVLNGMGIGLTLPAVNLLVLELNPIRSGSALSVLNFCWGLGAILCKPFVDLTSTRTDILLTSVILFLPLAVCACLLLLVSEPVRSPRERTSSNDPEGPSFPIWTTGLAWTIALFNFVHVGFESGIGGWLTTYSERVEGSAVVHLFSPTFLYFLFFVVGRGMAPLFFRVLSEDRLIFLNLGLMLTGSYLVLTAEGLTALAIGSSIAGFGASSVFPTNLSRFARIFGPTATRRATPLFISGTAGAAAVTWMIGFFSDTTGTLRAGMFVLLGCVLVLLVLQIALSIAVKRKSKSQAL